jgi:hypothetical protein
MVIAVCREDVADILTARISRRGYSLRLNIYVNENRIDSLRVNSPSTDTYPTGHANDCVE